MGSKEEFVEFLKEELSKRDWSHAELSRRSGISQAHISRVINNYYQPGLDFLKAISDTFNISLEFCLLITGIITKDKDFDKTTEMISNSLQLLNSNDREFVLAIINLIIERKKDQH